MSNVSVNLAGLVNPWKSACQKSIKDLNALFKKKGIKVTLVVGGTKKPSITVKTDASIGRNAVHGPKAVCWTERLSNNCPNSTSTTEATWRFTLSSRIPAA